MAAPADAVFVDGTIHVLGTTDRTETAVAVRNGAICRVADTYEVEFLNGIETERVDLNGRSVLPGFYDAHADLLAVGLGIERADLSSVSDREPAIEALRDDAEASEGWILGAGYDDSDWSDDQTIDGKALGAVSEERPVAALGADGETVALNDVAAERVTEAGGAVPADGILTGPKTELVWPQIAPGNIKRAKEYVAAALDQAVERGVTTVSAVVRTPLIARALHELHRADELVARVRMTYWAGQMDGPTPLAAVERLGLLPGAGNQMLQLESVGATVATAGSAEIEADGELAAGTIHSAPWLSPADVPDFIAKATAAGMPVTIHVKDKSSLTAVVEAIRGQSAPEYRLVSDVRLTEEAEEAIATTGGIVIARPKLAPSEEADESQSQNDSLNPETLRDSGVKLAMGGSVSMSAPLQSAARFRTGESADQSNVNPALRTVTAAHRASTTTENRDPFEIGTPADFVVLSGSPWETPPSELSVEMTVLDGQIVYRSD